MSSPRYAIYYAPEQNEPLWSFGSRVLGYDAITGDEVEPIDANIVSREQWRDWTAAPRGYGFHATMKAPFRLAERQSEAALIEALRVFAAACTTFVVPLVIETVGPFVAFVPAYPVENLHRLERQTVVAFEPFRAALTPDDRARRRPERLTEAQRTYLDRYGYPFVHDEFRFHLTLTDALPSDAQAVVLKMLRQRAAYLTPYAASVASLCLFRQDQSSSRFRLLTRARFPV